jgi:RNA polymerase sigma-70 factor, ECF subfamily
VSGPVDGRIACLRPCADGQLSVALWVLPGAAGHVAGVRRWAQAIAAAWGAAAADTALVVGRAADTVTVRALVAALPRGRRAVIAKLYYAGRTVTETAAVLGVPPVTVKSRACYALAALRSAPTAATYMDGTVPGGRAAR